MRFLWLLSAMVLVLFASLGAPLADSLFVAKEQPFALVVHNSLNTAYAMFRGPELFSMGPVPWKLHGVGLILGIVAALWNILSMHSKESTLETACGATWIAVIGAVLVFLVGIDIAVLSAVFSFLMTWLFLRASRISWLSVILVSFSILLAGPLSVIGIVGAVVFFGISAEGSFLLARESLFSRAVFLLLAAMTLSFLWPTDLYPHYPPESFLVPGYTSSLGVDPLVGFGPSRPLLNREALVTMLVPFSGVLLGAGVFMIFVSSLRTLGCVLGGAALIVYAELLGGHIAMLSPLGALARMVPALWSFPILSAFLALSIVGALVLVGSQKRYLLGTYFAALFLLVKPPSDTFFGYLLSPRAFAEAEREIIASPSLYVFKSEAHSLLRDAPKKPLEGVSVAHLAATVRASQRTELLTSIVQETKKERWSSGTGQQRGDEWVEVEFPESLNIAGLDLSLSRHFTDYPRGLRILGGSTCTESVLFERSRWLGSVAATSEGLPYFTHQSIIRIPLDTNRPVRCLRIEQTAQERSFEWSIERIEALRFIE